MADRLFVLQMEGIAESVDSYRPGARHALLVFATGPDLDSVQPKAIELLSSTGWTMIEVRRAKEIGADTETIGDDTLRSAAESALVRGSALIVYRDEINADS